MLMIGAKGKGYPAIQRRMAQLADAGGFRRINKPVAVAGGDAGLDGRLAEELRWFYGRLKGLVGDLPANDRRVRDLRNELEGEKAMKFRSSAVHAFRK